MNNKIYHSSDSPQYFYTSSISEEIDNLYLELIKKHKELSFEIFVVLRCLHSYSNWVTKGRFDTSEKRGLSLGIDVVVYEEDFEKIPNIRTNKVVQRIMFGKELFNFLTIKLNKSTRKIPYLKNNKDDVLKDIKSWCLDNYWLKEDKPIDFQILNWTLIKSELVFGKPFSKRVTDKIDKNIKLELKGLKYQNLIWNIDDDRKIESWFYLTLNKEWLCCWFIIT